VEEALTRVQMAKTRAIESKHRILMSGDQNSDTDHVEIIDDTGGCEDADQTK